MPEPFARSYVMPPQLVEMVPPDGCAAPQKSYETGGFAVQSMEISAWSLPVLGSAPAGRRTAVGNGHGPQACVHRTETTGDEADAL